MGMLSSTSLYLPVGSEPSRDLAQLSSLPLCLLPGQGGALGKTDSVGLLLTAALSWQSHGQIFIFLPAKFISLSCCVHQGQKNTIFLAIFHTLEEC